MLSLLTCRKGYSWVGHNWWELSQKAIVEHNSWEPVVRIAQNSKRWAQFLRIAQILRVIFILNNLQHFLIFDSSYWYCDWLYLSPCKPFTGACVWIIWCSDILGPDTKLDNKLILCVNFFTRFGERFFAGLGDLLTFFTWDFQLFYNYHLISSINSSPFEFYFVSGFVSGNKM